MVWFAGFQKKCKHHEPLKHTNMQQQLMPLPAYPERKLRRIVCWLLILSAEI